MRLGSMLALVILVAPPVAPSLDAQSNAGQQRSVALTFDDLPITSNRCDAAYVRNVTAKLTGVLEARSLPAAGLTTPAGECFNAGLLAETLARWREIGAVIGNHSATHPDFNSTSIKSYLANIARAQQLIDAAVRTDSRWFRAPLLHMGNSAAKKRALSAYLAANGYRIAPVTIDNQEWVYAAVYADARARGEGHLARRIADAYVEHIEASMAFYERLSMDVFRREIPQVLLLHANLLNAEQLGRVVDMLLARGYSFVSLPQAVADAAYARDDTYVGARGLSWLQRWALEDGVPVPPEPREAEWVARAFRQIQQRGAGQAAVPDARQEIAAASRAFSQAYVAGDTATIRELYMPDAILLPPDREVRGRDAIARYFAPGTRSTNVAHAMVSDELRIINDMAVDVGIWSHTSRVNDGSLRRATGRYLVVWRRGEDGRWRIEHDMWHRPAN